ncbi:MAG: hypothetical protein RL407_1952 [Bacteroidota bacterium]|jgi:hypothetical protein
MANHLINSLRFEIQVPSTTAFDQLVKETPTWVKNTLLEVIEEVISSSTQGSELLVIPSLEIDLGNIGQNQFSKELAGQFKSLFKQAFEDYLKVNVGKGRADQDLPLRILSYFLKYGRRPAWSGVGQISFQRNLALAIQNKPKNFSSLLIHYAKNPLTKKRIIEQVSEEGFESALSLRYPQESQQAIQELESLKVFFKERFRHLGESGAVKLYKQLLLDLLTQGKKVDRSTIFHAIEYRLGEVVLVAFQKNIANKATLQGTSPTLRSRKLSMVDSRIESPSGLGLLFRLEYFLLNGTSPIDYAPGAYRYRNIHTLFQEILNFDLEALVEFLLANGNQKAVRRRFLGALSQDLIAQFFYKVAPEKRKLLEWVGDVFEKVQQDYKPINQTLIQVKKSLNEITYDLFLTKNLNSISDENYLRILFKKTATKYGISYKKLLFYTLKSISSAEKNYRVFNFNQTLGNIYVKDILKRRAYTSSDWVLFREEFTEGQASSRLANKEDISSFFSELHLEFGARLNPKATHWLATKLRNYPIQNLGAVISLWEEYASTFSIPVGDLLLPLLLSEPKTSVLPWSTSERNFLMKKYGLKGIYSSQRVDLSELVSSLLEAKNFISRKVLKQIFLGIFEKQSLAKLDFRRFVTLIEPSMAKGMSAYLDWLSTSLGNVPKERVYGWLFHHLLTLPTHRRTIKALRENTEEFLQQDEVLEKGVDGKKGTLKLLPKPIITVVNGPRRSNESQQTITYFFEILSLDEVYSIFPDARRYNYSSLFSLLTTKYASSFFQLLKTHQFNQELQELVFIQSPKWFKMQVIDFLYPFPGRNWRHSFTALKEYFVANKWVDVKGNSLEYFIESYLWNKAFESSPLKFEDSILELLQKAMKREILSPKFWKDLKLLDSKSSSSSINRSLVQLTSSLNFAYFSTLGKFQQTKPDLGPVFESLVYDFTFPVGHRLEKEHLSEHKAFLNQLIVDNKATFLKFAQGVSPSYFIYRFFTYLEVNSLKYLVKEKHKQEKIAISLAQLQTIEKLFNIKEEVKSHRLYSTWLIHLQEAILHQQSTSKLVFNFLEILLEQGGSGDNASDLAKRLETLFVQFSFTDQEKKDLREKIKQAFPNPTAERVIFSLHDLGEIKEYFLNGKDPFMKSMLGAEFFKSWLSLFLEEATTAEVHLFLDFYGNALYRKKFSESRKMELFIRQFFRLGVAESTFLQVSKLENSGREEFKKYAPELFSQLDAQVKSKEKTWNLLEMIGYFLDYGVLPKQMKSLSEFAKLLQKLSGSDLVQLRLLFHAAIVSISRKKHFLALLSYFDESWLYGIIHPRFLEELDLLTREVEERIGINLIQDLGLDRPMDRSLQVVELWAIHEAQVNEPQELLLPLVENWMVAQEQALVLALFSNQQKKSPLLQGIENASKKVKRILNEKKEEKAEEKEEVQVVEEGLGEGIPVFTAGIILCWPFLGRFFSALGLVEQGKFMGQQAEERGVLLLHYLSTGKTQVEEWDLTLEKILCGVALDQPIPASLELSSEEEELCRKLINGTIFNWEKMRGTRLETFRETFLLREGRLFDKDNRWELIVERKAYDVLMDTLTWNISMINLSWMKKRLTVQWK